MPTGYELEAKPKPKCRCGYQEKICITLLKTYSKVMHKKLFKSAFYRYYLICSSHTVKSTVEN